MQKIAVKYILYLCAAISGLLFLISPETAHAQEDRNILHYKIIDSDTVFLDRLPPVYCFNKPNDAKSKKQWREFYRTVYNFKKVYPYALQAKQLLNSADSTIEARGLKGRAKDRYVEDFKRDLFKQFEKPLRKLTYSQGRMLLRLVERECGIPTYYIIKNYVGGASAGFWQGVAKLFGSDLKRPYDRFGKDKILEELIAMYKDGSFVYLYQSIFGHS